MEYALVQDVLPELAAELTAGLIAQGDVDLASQVPMLRMVDRCRCGDSFCASVYTAPRPRDGYGAGHETVCVEETGGDIILDVVNREIRHIEILHRDDVRPKVVAMFP